MGPNPPEEAVLNNSLKDAEQDLASAEVEAGGLNVCQWRGWLPLL